VLLPVRAELVDAALETLAQLALEVTTSVVLRRRSHDGGAKIPETQLVEMCESRLGPIHPHGRLHVRLQLFGERQDGVSCYRRSAFGLGPVLFVSDRPPHFRHAARRQSLGDELLLGGQSRHEFVAMCRAGLESYRPSFRPRRPIRWPARTLTSWRPAGV
jgi:hypothetical protein